MATLQTLPDATTRAPAPRGSGAATPLAMRSFLYAVFKHRRLVLGVFLARLPRLGGRRASCGRKWLASSKVLVKLGETVQLAPAEAPSRSINHAAQPGGREDRGRHREELRGRLRRR